MTTGLGRAVNLFPSLLRRVGTFSLLLALGLPLLAVLLALLVGAGIMLVIGADPILGYRALFRSGLGGAAGISATLTLATPLIIVGVGIAFAFRGSALNVGGEGQIFLGALGAGLVGLLLPLGTSLVHLPAALFVSFVFGAVWAMIAAVIKWYRGPHEVVVTLLMNFIAILFVQYMVQGPLVEPGRGFPETAPVARSAQLPLLPVGVNLHSGILVALLVAVIMYVVLFRTAWGFAVRVLGQGHEIARYSGINPARTFIMTMGVSGGLSGLAGGVHILGMHKRLVYEVSPGFGFEGIAVALIGLLHPIGVVPAALFFGFLRVGQTALQVTAGVPGAVVMIIQALAIIFIAVSLVWRNRFIRIFGRTTAEGERPAEYDQRGLELT